MQSRLLNEPPGAAVGEFAGWFDQPVDRKDTGCMKWDEEPCSEFPLWVADMDFRVVPAVSDALARRVEQGVFGYAMPTDSYYDSVIRWHKEQHGAEYQKRWIIVVPGVVPAISAILRALTQPGEGVLTLSPVYNCFFSSIRNLGCRAEESVLLCHDGKYTIDMDDLEQRAAKPDVNVMLLCSPHNPTGRLWTTDELTAVADICVRHGVFLVSDEIHCELTMPGDSFVPLLTLDHPVREHACICTSASKAFNMAGLQNAQVVCPDDSYRQRIDRAVNIHEVCDVNPFGLVATEAAYTSGQPWLEELRSYIQGNYNALADYLLTRHHQLSVARMQATYLMWMDVRSFGLDDEDFCNKLLKHGSVRLAPGSHYGKGGEGFVRINLATQRHRLLQAAKRIDSFLNSLA